MAAQLSVGDGSQLIALATLYGFHNPTAEQRQLLIRYLKTAKQMLSRFAHAPVFFTMGLNEDPAEHEMIKDFLADKWVDAGEVWKSGLVPEPTYSSSNWKDHILPNPPGFLAGFIRHRLASLNTTL